MKPIVFVVIDRDDLDRFIAEKVLNLCGEEEVFAFWNTEHALQFLKDGSFIQGVVIIALNLIRDKGWELMDELQRFHKDGKCVDVYITTVSAQPADIELAAHYVNFKGMINKPLTIEKVKDHITGG